MSVVDTIYNDFRDAVQVLQDAKQISLQIMLEANLRKTLLLGAASYFEMRLTREVQAFTDEVTNRNEMVGTLIQQKAITRQYHSWFDWDKNNANKFFGMFGPVFKSHMAEILAKDAQLNDDIRSFLLIGAQRNYLVHSDYVSVYIDKTPAEIYSLYEAANRFVDTIGGELRSCSSKITATDRLRD